MSLLEVRELKKSYPVRKRFPGRGTSRIYAVDDVSFHLNRGEVLGLVGESGSGKTSLGRCIARLIDPDSGQIYFQGHDLVPLSEKHLRPMRRHLQVIFQDPCGSLNPRMTASAIIEEPLKIHKIGSRTDRKRAVQELMNLVGLDDSLGSRFPHQFSGGQRQRIGIARALALHPQLIVADEPVSSLDPPIQAQIMNLLKELQERLSLSFLFIAHDLSVVHYFSDRVAVMYLGKFVELAPAMEVFRHPLHPYTRLLLDSVPVTDPGSRRQNVRTAGDIPSPVNPPSGCRFHTRCPIATQRCKVEEPQLRELANKHFAACHLAG